MSPTEQTQQQTASSSSTNGAAKPVPKSTVTIIATPEDISHQPPWFILVLGLGFTTWGLFCNFWQLSTTMIAFVSSFTGHKLYLLNAQVLFGTVLPITISCFIIAAGAQGGLIYFVFQVRSHWSENAQGASAGMGGVIKHTAVEVKNQGGLVMVWVLASAGIGILGDVTYISSYTSDVINMAAYIFFLYAFSTIGLLAGLAFLQAATVAYHKWNAWKRALYGPGEKSTVRPQPVGSR